MGLVDYTRIKSRARAVAGDVPKWISNSKRSGYILSVCLSCPPWVSRADLYALQAEARRITEETGELHVLDHIVPLNHPRVCGLTVPWNFRIVHWRVNASKGNDWCPEQDEMFPLS